MTTTDPRGAGPDPAPSRSTTRQATAVARPGEPGLPLVVQLGFAGSRTLVDRQAHPEVDPERFEELLVVALRDRLIGLPTDLKLSGNHFICGLSQVAIGADMVFTKACRALGWSQRILLPEHRAAYLTAIGSTGKPDFTEAERAVAIELLSSSHIIQERVVSDAAERADRFTDVNLELARISDVVVCLVRANAGGSAGGTSELISIARDRGRPVLVLQVAVQNGKPVLTGTWAPPGTDGVPTTGGTGPGPRGFVAPALAADFAGLSTSLSPSDPVEKYLGKLKGFLSETARSKQKWFKVAALIIIGTHVAATVIAAIGLKLHGGILPVLVAIELGLLGVGFLTHWSLHHSRAAGIWATARLGAEIGRSCLALRGVPGHLGHLFNLQLPASFRSLLRTLNVLHLRDDRAEDTPWQTRRDSYLKERIEDQIAFYGKALRRARTRRWFATTAFTSGSVLAMLAAVFKLTTLVWTLPILPAVEAVLTAILGPAAVVLPVVAVAALSLAASFDLDARVNDYGEMLRFLESQRNHLKDAGSERAFASLALEAEARLLGETADWYSRNRDQTVT